MLQEILTFDFSDVSFKEFLCATLSLMRFSSNASVTLSSPAISEGFLFQGYVLKIFPCLDMSSLTSISLKGFRLFRFFFKRILIYNFILNEVLFKCFGNTFLTSYKRRIFLPKLCLEDFSMFRYVIFDIIFLNWFFSFLFKVFGSFLP